MFVPQNVDILVVHVRYEFHEKMMSTPQSQNQRHEIKNSNWATHRTWHVGIWQATSAYYTWNQPRPERIRRRMCASNK